MKIYLIVAAMLLAVVACKKPTPATTESGVSSSVEATGSATPSPGSTATPGSAGPSKAP